MLKLESFKTFQTQQRLVVTQSTNSQLRSQAAFICVYVSVRVCLCECVRACECVCAYV